jgi:short-subunit dehydrogenase
VSRAVAIFGATSGMAEAVARRYAAEGAALFLVARQPAKLELLAGNLRDLGAAAVHPVVADLDDLDRHAEWVAQAQAALGRLDVVLLAHGTLGDQRACERDFALAARELHTNFLSHASLCTHLGNLLEGQGGGTLGVITSVAGERGRQSNYVYGSAKGALTLFTQGLRNRLHAHGVRVVTLIPGFVDTPMTAGLKKGPLFVSAATAGAAIHRALEKPRDVVYVPWFWRHLMRVIRLIPESLFKKLKL